MSEHSSPPSSDPTEEPPKKQRRFAPEPVETTTRSSKKASKDNGQDLSQDKTDKRDFAKKTRFSPMPIETTSKSSKKSGRTDLSAPEPTQISISRSSPREENPKTGKRFTPVLIETTKRSKRSNVAGPATLPTDKVNNRNSCFEFTQANSHGNGRQISLREFPTYTPYVRKEPLTACQMTTLPAPHSIKFPHGFPGNRAPCVRTLILEEALVRIHSSQS